MIRLLILVVFLSSCGAQNDGDYVPGFTPLKSQRPDGFIDPALQSLVDEFRRDMTAAGLVSPHPTVRVERGDMNEKMGLCWAFGETDGKVKNAWWVVVIRRSLDPASVLVKTIMYHELTHCDYGIDHSDRPYTIMYPSVEGDDDYWTSTWTERVAELVENIKTTLGVP